MSTAAAPKSRYLQSLSNIDLAHRNKKVITTPTRLPRPSVPTQAKASKDAPVDIPNPRPLGVVETAPVKPSRVRRVYDKAFLLSLKYTCTDFPPGVPTPDELVAQYNKDMELRDSKERQAMLESSSLSTSNIFAAGEKSSTPAGVVVRAAADKERVREKKAASTAGGLKLRIPSAKGLNVSRLPMFSPKVDAIQLPVQASMATQDNKENSSFEKNVPAATSVAKKLKLAATSPSVTTPTITDANKKVSYVAAVAPAEVKPEPVNIVETKPVEASSVVEKVEDSLDDITKKMKSVLKEEDPRRLAQRQKQIDYGKNTLGYSNYTASVAKSKRKREDPKTPNKNQICSKRSWDGQIRKWRRQLHFYDPEGVELDESEMNGDAENTEVPAAIESPTPIAIELSVN